MSEIRQDPTTKEWVIIATERRKRPSDFIQHSPVPEKPHLVHSCPFCPGNEEMTPEPVLTRRDEKTGEWQIRVVANRFPAVGPDGDTTRHLEKGGFLRMDGIGFHEVVIDTPLHNRPPALMTDVELAGLLHVYRQRYEEIARSKFVQSIIIFKNHGPGAGTSLEHPHSQIVAMGVVPRHMRIKYEVAISYFDDNGRSLYTDLAARELEAGTRIIMETDRFVAFHPFASFRPFETWIMPKSHHASFRQASVEDIEGLAPVLRMVLLKLYRGLDNPDFNLVVESAPVGEERADFYQWHIRIVPRISEVAGFEIGSGIYINTALPEETAGFMRDLQV